MMIKSTLSKSIFVQRRLVKPKTDLSMASVSLSLSAIRIRFFSSTLSAAPTSIGRQLSLLSSKEMKGTTKTMTILQKNTMPAIVQTTFGRAFSDNNNNNGSNNNNDGKKPGGDNNKSSSKISDIFDRGSQSNSGGSNVEDLFRARNPRNNNTSNIFSLRRTPAQQEILNRQHKQQQEQERQRFLRTHAVQLFPGNYEDDDDEGNDRNGGFKRYNQDYLTPGHPRGREDKEQKLREDQEASYLYDSDEEKEEQLSRLYKKQHEEETRQKKKWIENSKPPVRYIQIDDRGRAYGRGGRKTAAARVWIQPGDGYVVVNKREFTDYFERETDRQMICEPFLATNTCCKFDVTAMVKGGGLTGQAGAIRLGVARALQNYNPKLNRPPLKKLGFLKRDPRKVERKKVGRVKARKRPQWVKR